VCGAGGRGFEVGSGPAQLLNAVLQDTNIEGSGLWGQNPISWCACFDGLCACCDGFCASMDYIILDQRVATRQREQDAQVLFYTVTVLT
jgi:hypothetical protein